MSNLVDKAMMLQVITCLDSLLDRANHDEYLTRIGKKEALKFLEENEKYANIIKSNLQRLEVIENAKPSEAFEKLDKVNNYLNDVYDYKEVIEEVRKDIDTVKQTLIKAYEDEEENKRLWNDITTVSKQYTDLMLEYQEQEQVIEIIKKKGIDIGWLRQCNMIEEYNYHCEAKQLTQEEFDLLKRWVE